MITHYKKTNNRTECNQIISSVLLVTNRWSKVTCPNCLAGTQGK
jgi:hypothetical protein